MNPDTSTVDPILNLIPEGYKGLVLAVFILAPIFGRAYHAIVSGGGLKGIWTALMFGTNTPKMLIASLCLLTVAACTLSEAKASGKRVLSATAKAAEDAALAEVRRLTSAKQPVNVTP